MQVPAFLDICLAIRAERGTRIGFESIFLDRFVTSTTHPKRPFAESSPGSLQAAFFAQQGSHHPVKCVLDIAQRRVQALPDYRQRNSSNGTLDWPISLVVVLPTRNSRILECP